MNIIKLQELRDLKKNLQINDLKILCTGELEVDYQDLLELQILEDGRNLKETDDNKILKLAESLLRFGIVNNLQIWIDKDKNHFCFDAHHRKKALTILSEIGVNIPALPATRCLAKTKNDAKKLLLIKESRTSWVNVEVVPDYIKEIGFSFEVAEAVIDLPEFSWGDVERERDNKDNSQDDEIPELPTQIFIKTGNLIELDRHRLLCGDCKKTKNVKKLMDGEKADLVFTDPPYGIDVVGPHGKIGGGGKKYPTTKFKAVIGDDKEFNPAFVLQYADKSFIWGGNYFAHLLPKGGKWFVWDKGHSENLGFSDCELAWSNIKGIKIKKFDCVWSGFRREGESNQNKRMHPNQKPVKLFSDILDELNPTSILDLFLGSGSTLIAAEKTGRQCFGMEIDPEYCQVIIQRWCDFTGQDKIKINSKNINWSELTGAI
jgi:DNA modification methylase